jgi:cyanophycin synthetase
MLFPNGCKPSIPIIAITGTNGKTTTSRLIAHMVKYMGYRVGFTTTDGIYIQEKTLIKGDTTGPEKYRICIARPNRELCRAGMCPRRYATVRVGIPTCDVGIVTNVAADHLVLGRY